MNAVEQVAHLLITLAVIGLAGMWLEQQSRL